jgi:hypothetical protein
MEKYKKVKTIKKMIENNGFGSPIAPIRILYLRYFLFKKDSVAISNLIKTVGKRFYILNDIENRTIPIFVELRLQLGIWHIFVLKQSI